MRHFLNFERPIAELEGKIEELRHLSTESGLNIAEEEELPLSEIMTNEKCRRLVRLRRVGEVPSMSKRHQTHRNV